MQQDDASKPIHVTFAAPDSGESVSLLGYLWFLVRHFGMIANKLSPLVSIVGFFVVTFIAHQFGLGAWSLAVGALFAVPAWFYGGGLLYWLAFAVVAAGAAGLLGLGIFLFVRYIVA